MKSALNHSFYSASPKWLSTLSDPFDSWKNKTKNEEVQWELPTFAGPNLSFFSLGAQITFLPLHRQKISYSEQEMLFTISLIPKCWYGLPMFCAVQAQRERRGYTADGYYKCASTVYVSFCRFCSCSWILSALKLHSTRAYTISSNFWQLLLSLTSLPDLWQNEQNPCLVYNQHKVLIILEFNTQGQKAPQTMQTQIHSLAFWVNNCLVCGASQSCHN